MNPFSPSIVTILLAHPKLFQKPPHHHYYKLGLQRPAGSFKEHKYHSLHPKKKAQKNPVFQTGKQERKK
jgi:hypothetical protein